LYLPALEWEKPNWAWERKWKWEWAIGNGGSGIEKDIPVHL